MPAGAYVIRTTSASGAVRSTSRLVVRVLPTDPKFVEPVVFAFTCDDPPLAIRCEGDLHSVCVETSFWVGEWFDWVEVSVKLKDGAGRFADLIDRVHLCYHGAFPGSETSHDEVLEIVDVSEENGIATVKVRITADEESFPAGFFGDTLRRLEVKVNGCKNVGIARFRCDELWSGMEFTWLEDACGPRPEPGTAPEPDPDCGARMRQFRVVSTENTAASATAGSSSTTHHTAPLFYVPD